MATSGSSLQRTIYQVGDLLIDAGRATVHRGKQPLHVQGLSFDLLLVLVESAPNLLTHDEIMTRVWKGLVVGPETLSQRIKLLRAALEDNARTPRYIEVVRGRGLRLVVDVGVVDETTAPLEPATSIGKVPDTAHQRQAAPQRRWIIASVAMLVAVAGASLILVQPGAGARQQASEGGISSDTHATRPTVAVLPFDAGTSSADDRVLVLGIAETLLHQLAQSPDLVVIARESSFVLAEARDRDQTVRRLNANYLVTGSVQREGEALRITTHLVDAKSGAQLWSRRFDRPRRDLFALQDEISAEVAAALQLNVEQQRQISSPHSATRSMAAWLAYQEGREHLARRSRDELVAAASQFEAALQADPRFAAAMAALAETQILRSMSVNSEFWATSRPQMTEAERTRALQLIGSALQIDDENGEAYAARAWLQQDPALGLQDARRGVELAPNNATALTRLAQLVYRMPRQKSAYDRTSRLESLELLKRAEKIDPLSAPTLLLLARGYLYSFSDVAQALSIAERLTVEHPDFHPGWVVLGEIRWFCRGEIARAIVALEHARNLDPHAQWTRDFLSQAYLDIEDTVAARAVISDPEFARSATYSALLMLDGQYADAIDRGIDYLSEDTTGLNAAVLTQAMYAELATAMPRPASVQLARQLAKASGNEPGARALVAAQQLKLGDSAGRESLLAAISDMKEIAYVKGRGDIFFLRDLINSQLAAGELDAALATHRRATSPQVRVGGFWFQSRNPLLDPLRNRPEFIEGYNATRMHMAAERREVERLRTVGQLPRYKS